jgi:Arc/MetJ-type ribon-helix-helix transcriptional regulator
MKVSVSLPTEDVRFLDAYAEDQGLESRSAALQKAVRLLRVSELSAQYESAWDEWQAGEDGVAWEGTAGDGIEP